MITEYDLQTAIAECLAEPNPSSKTCIKLAAFYTIKNELYSKEDEQCYSFASEPEYKGQSEFAEVIRGMNTTRVLSIIDELMQTLSVLNPKLYASVIRKMREG